MTTPYAGADRNPQTMATVVSSKWRRLRRACPRPASARARPTALKRDEAPQACRSSSAHRPTNSRLRRTRPRESPKVPPAAAAGFSGSSKCLMLQRPLPVQEQATPAQHRTPRRVALARSGRQFTAIITAAFSDASLFDREPHREGFEGSHQASAHAQADRRPGERELRPTASTISCPPPRSAVTMPRRGGDRTVAARSGGVERR